MKTLFCVVVGLWVAAAAYGQQPVPPAASTAEVLAGTDTYKYVTPAGLSGAGLNYATLTTNTLSTTWYNTNGYLLYGIGFTNTALNTVWYPQTGDPFNDLQWSNTAGYYTAAGGGGIDMYSPSDVVIYNNDQYDWSGFWVTPLSHLIDGHLRLGTNTLNLSYSPSTLAVPYNFFKNATRNMALSNAASGTYAGVTMNRYNAGNKTGYDQEYLRDFVLAMQATNVCTHTQLWIRAYCYSQNTLTNAVPDLFKNTNVMTLGTFGNSVDSAYYYTFLVHLGYEQAVREGLSNPTRIFTNFITTITNSIQSGVTHDSTTKLVTMAGDRIGWGFHDNLYQVKTGLVSMESLLEAAAYGKIAQLSYAVGNATYTNVGDWAADKLNTISASIVTNLFDWNVGLFKACSTKTNYDVIASAFAVHADVVPVLVKQRISKAFIDGYYNGSEFTAGRGFWQRGRLSHCRRGEKWQHDPYYFKEEFGKHYQYGGYWPFGGWGADALAVYRPDLAQRAIADFYEGLASDAEFWEWTNVEYASPLVSTISSQIYLMCPGAGLHYGRKEFVLP